MLHFIHLLPYLNGHCILLHFIHLLPYLNGHCKFFIEVKVQSYTLINGQLYKRGKDGNLRLCVLESKFLDILHHAHAAVLTGGHFSRPTIVKTILWSRLWWLMLHLDVLEYVKGRDHCQHTKPQ